MRLNKLLYSILPKSVFSKVRINYYKYRKKFHRPLTEQKVKAILTDTLDIHEGSVIFVHSSLDFLNINFSPYRLLTLLIEVVGEEGTLIFPAWHFNYRAEDYLNNDLVFDVKRSPTVMGLLPELARRQPNAYRSSHPTTSIVALGKHAKELIEDHEKSIYPCGELSPYYKMMKYNAKIIGLGVNANFLSFVHCPEDVLKDKFPLKTRMDKVFTAKVKRLDGRVVEVDTLAAHQNIAIRHIPDFLNAHVSRAVFSKYIIRGNDFYKADSNLLYNCIINLAAKGLTIYNH